MIKTRKDWWLSLLNSCKTGSIVDYKRNEAEDCSDPIDSDDLIEILNLPKPLTVACEHGHLELVKYLLTSEDSMSTPGHCSTDIHADNEAAFNEACGGGHLEVVKYLLTSPDLALAGHTPVDPNASYAKGLRLACEKGHLDVVKYLLTSKELTSAGHSFANLHMGQEMFLQLACSNGQLAVVQYLLTSQELINAGHTFADLHAIDSFTDLASFHTACEAGQWAVVRYLLTSQDLLSAGHTFPDLNANDDYALQMACAHGNLEMVKYLLTSPELVRAGHTPPNLKANNWHLGYKVLSKACSSKQWDIVHWLVTECSIEKTNSIKKLSKRHPKLANIFRIRADLVTLQSTLNEAPATSIQVKRL